MFLGNYSEWLVDYPDLLGDVIPIILSSLGNPEVALSSTMALKEITHSCQKFVLPFAEHILISAQVKIFFCYSEEIKQTPMLPFYLNH